MWSTIRDSLGLQRPLEVREPEPPFEVSDAARARLGALPAGHGVHLALSEEGPDTWLVHTEEGPSQGPPPDNLSPLPISASDADLHQLGGLELHHSGARWVISLHLELRARETPNPDSRQYLCNRWLALGRPLFFSQEDDAPTLAVALLAIDGVETVLIRANTVTLERTPRTPWGDLDRGVDSALRGYLLRCGRPLADADVPGAADGLEAEILAVLEQRILPAIHRDGGDLELLGVSDGVVRVSLVGACRSCPSSTITLKAGVERTLVEAFPGQVQRVEQV